MNITYYCIISVIVFIILLILVNIAFDDEELSRYEDAFRFYAVCLLVPLSWPTSLSALIVAGIVYILNLFVKKIIDVLKLK